MARPTSPGQWLVVLLWVVVVVIVGFFAVFAFVAGHPPESATITRACEQPDTVSYEKGATYAVFVRNSSSLSLGHPPSTAVVGRSGNDGSYGVFVPLGSSFEASQVTCRWEQDRVDIVEPGGIVHTVPAHVFIGGR